MLEEIGVMLVTIPTSAKEQDDVGDNTNIGGHRRTHSPCALKYLYTYVFKKYASYIVGDISGLV
jgi:hypothetical protein